MSWISQEFSGIDLGDVRLNKRLEKLGQKLFEKPLAAINEACGGWSDTKAAYRLFDNEKVGPSKLLEVHRRNTLKRMANYETVLAIQDTTFFNYDSHKSKSGLGNIHSNTIPVKGLLAHNTLMATAEGLPLGLFEQKIYVRKNKKRRSKHYAKIEEKESYRWVEPLEKLSESKRKGQRVIVVGDREADIFELMHSCHELGLDFLIRSVHNRTVGERSKKWEEGLDQQLLDFVDELEVKAQKKLNVHDSKTRKERLAKVEIRFMPVSLPAPWRLDYAIDGPSKKNKKRAEGSRAKVEAYVLDVREIDPPKDATKIHWRLITSLPVKNLKDAAEAIEHYKMRWTIEIYHRVLKSGCRVEDCRLETFERLERCLTLYSIIAWRLLWLSRVSREEPEIDCSKFFSKKEWLTLYRIRFKTNKTPQTKPTIHQVVRWMARLGGFLDRKSDGEPGITTIWRGWQTLNNFLTLKTYG